VRAENSSKDIARDQAGEAGATSRGEGPVLCPGRTCWRIERARRLAFLVDGEDYFAAVRAAIVAAQRSIFILGWDIDSRMRLMPQGAPDRYPAPLGEFLDAIVGEREDLHAYVLAWDFAMLYAFEREWLPIYQFDWKTNRRMSFHLDNRHPLGGCHHQKIIVVDDDIALLGGFDLTRCRWDTPAHDCKAPLRKDASGTPYGPFHDIGAIVDGDCARALGELARERWRRATGHTPPPAVSAATSGAWPSSVPVDLRDVDVAIARTEPAFAGSPGVTEVKRLHVDAIASARRRIFAENQYFTSRTIADAFATRLAEPDAPEIALLMPANQSGWLETSTMGVLRARLHRRLRAADPRNRYRLYCPTLPWLDDGDECLNVHSKVMIVDDELMTLGSANLSERSQSLDTECNIAIEARGDTRIRDAIVALRERLLAEHLDTQPRQVGDAMVREGSLHRAIEALGNGKARRLNAFDPSLDPTIDALTPDHDILDPERPLDPDVVVADLLPAPEPRSRVRQRMVVIALFVVALAGLALAWRYTPLAGVIDFDTMSSYAEQIAQSPFAPLAVMLAYVIGGLLVVPVTLLIGVTAAVFGPLLGGAYALAGALLSACATYAIGRRLGHDSLRRFAGRRLNRLSQRLGHRGLLAMVIVRLLPIAPYSMVNVVAGASHIGWRDFLLGTAIGMAPGIVGIALFVDRAVVAIRHPGPMTFAALIAIVALLAMVGWMLRRQLDGPQSPGSATSPANTTAAMHAD
jgi:phospholipase D1/2